MRIGLSLRIVAASAAFFVCTSQGATGQAPSQTGHDSLIDIPDTLASGTVVRIRNIRIFRSQNSSALTVYIETPTPSTEPERLGLEAKEVAGLQIKSLMTGNLTRVSVAVCRTIGCGQMREKPEELFLFVRKSDGSLEAEKQPSPTAVDANPPLMRIISLLVGEWSEPVCGTQPPQGEFIWFAGGDYCEWITPTQGRIVAQRDDQHHVHAVILNRQTNNEAHAHEIIDSLATTLRSFGLTERECAPGSSPAGAIRSWLYEDRTGLIVHLSEITGAASPPRLLALAVDVPNAFPPGLCN